MRALYPKLRRLHSAAAAVLLSACEQAAPPDTRPSPAEPWSNEHEVLFQEAEALKFSLEQHRLEEQRLRDAQVPVTPGAPR